MCDVVTESLREELVRGGKVLLTVAEEHARPAIEGAPCGLGHQRGLTETGLPRNEDDPEPFSASGAFGGVSNQLELALAPHDPQRRPNYQPRRQGYRAPLPFPREGIPHQLNVRD